MEDFKTFCEAWLNRVAPKRAPEVSSNKQFEEPQQFMKNANFLGKVGNLHLYSSDTSGGGMAHFTWSPTDKKIHHVLYAANSTSSGGSTTLQYLSAHGRKNSPVRMSDVYSSLVKDHDRVLVATSHSPGAAKMWDRFHNDEGLQVHGFHADTKEIKPLSRDDSKYVEYTNKDPQAKRLGNMRIVLSKAGSEVDTDNLR